MDFINWNLNHPLFFMTLAVVFGLIVGSFLNVVIYRLPIMLQQAWRNECLQLLHETTPDVKQPLNLWLPRSHCPHCQFPVAWRYNIPLIGFLLLRGRCANCWQAISWRYPLVELLTALLTAFIVIKFGCSWQTLAALAFTWFLLAATFIDLETQLLPDELTLALLWLGLLVNTASLFAPTTSAIVGAVCGYCSLWLVGWLFQRFRGVAGMGHGDYKLFAAFGAWFGWQALPSIILVAALVGSIIGIMLIFSRRIQTSTPIAFGPYLALAGWLCLFWPSPLLGIW